MDGGVDLGAYVLGTAGLVATLGALWWGAWSLRVVLLPGWKGATARLAEVVIVLAVGLGVAQVLGAFGVLSAPAVLIAEVTAGLAVGGVARWSGPRRAIDAGAVHPASHRSPWEWALAAVAIGIVVLQWVSHTIDALGRGMSHADTLWYHLPFAARFLQTGGFGELDGVGYEAARWFPFDAHLVQALAILPYDRDWLVPVLNLGWLALALLAAWCIGERRGSGPVAVALAAVAAGAPILAATQPGQASTDIACAALLLAAVALVLESDLRPPQLAIAGVATGLAISTKVTLALPIAVLGLAVFALVALRRRWAAAGLWAVGILATGTFWFGRNWVLGGNPLPWFDLPPLFERATVAAQEPSLLKAGQFDVDTWTDVYLPGLRRGLAAAWPAVLALVVVGAALLVRGRCATERIAGLVVAAGVVGYLATPLTAGISFGFNLRYLGPTVMLAGALVPLVVPEGVRWRIGQTAAALALVVIGATAEHLERTPAWPTATPVAWLVVAGVTAAVVAWRVVGAPRWSGVAIVTAAVVSGFPLARWSTEGRYVDAGVPPTDAIPEAMRDVRDASVGLFGSVETYPLFGLNLSNDVEIGAPPPPGSGSGCRRWREHLGGRYEYVVVSPFGLYPGRTPGDALAEDPAVTEVARDGEHAVFRIDGPLDPDACDDG